MALNPSPEGPRSDFVHSLDPALRHDAFSPNGCFGLADGLLPSETASHEFLDVEGTLLAWDDLLTFLRGEKILGALDPKELVGALGSDGRADISEAYERFSRIVAASKDEETGRILSPGIERARTRYLARIDQKRTQKKRVLQSALQKLSNEALFKLVMRGHQLGYPFRGGLLGLSGVFSEEQMELLSKPVELAHSLDQIPMERQAYTLTGVRRKRFDRQSEVTTLQRELGLDEERSTQFMPIGLLVRALDGEAYSHTYSNELWPHMNVRSFIENFAHRVAASLPLDLTTSWAARSSESRTRADGLALLESEYNLLLERWAMLPTDRRSELRSSLLKLME